MTWEIADGVDCDSERDLQRIDEERRLLPVIPSLDRPNTRSPTAPSDRRLLN
ncbi:hypothetical protein REMIM1_PF00755 (plasmid) [Rhizobium etli bv. mimosae str. Mim1]|nr:hypothetical protein REMIM1_PF00755 [Rhizobium etli bv. mimosae str. Mim1]